MSDYLASLRESLAEQRRQRVPFEQAWIKAREVLDPGDFYLGVASKGALTRFMRRHFEAAYGGTVCFKVESPTASNGAASVAPVQSASRPKSLPRCKSGDGCDRNAVRGRFGFKWCDHHGTELERLADSLGWVEAEAA